MRFATHTCERLNLILMKTRLPGQGTPRAVRILALVTGAALTLSACSAGHTSVQYGRISGAGNGAGPGDAAGTASDIVVALAGAPASLDFTTTSGAAIPQAMMGNIYEGLVKINKHGEIEPLLASSWEVDPSGTRYVFHLRQDVRFSNGTRFDAETAKFSIERVAEWTNGLKAKMKPVEKVTVLDPFTLEVTLSGPSNSWLWNMGTFVGAMMAPDGVAELATNPVGTGPYVVSGWAVGQALSFTARDDYWGEKPKNSQATLRYFADAIASTNALLSNDVDVVYNMQSPELVATLEKNPNLVIDVGATNGDVLLTMNPRRAPFDDVRVRRAIMYAIDREAVIDTAWDGFGINTGGAPVAPTDPWYFTATQYPFDPDKARELLAEAGVAPGTKLTLSVPSLAYARLASEMVVSQLADVGLDVKIHSTEFPAVWLAEVYKAHEYDMSIISHAEARDVVSIFGNPDYYVGYDSQRVRDLFTQADTGPASEEDRVMRQAVEQILDDAAADNLFNFPNIVVRRSSITGIAPTSATGALELASIAREVVTSPSATGKGNKS